MPDGDVPETIPDRSPSRPPPSPAIRGGAWRRRFDWTLSLTTSALLHLCLLVGGIAVLSRSFSLRPVRSGEGTVSTRAAGPETALPPTLSPDDAKKPVPETGSAEVRIDSGSLTELIRREFQQQVQSGEAAEPAQRMARLDELGQRLHGISSEARVLAVTDRISQALGVVPRPAASPPVTSDEPIDLDRAQLENVLKEADADGRIVYTGILIDPDGRTMRVELDAAEGEELSRLFETMRRYPLLEKVYRSVVMSLLDQPLHRSRQTAPAVPPSQP